MLLCAALCAAAFSGLLGVSPAGSHSAQPPASPVRFENRQASSNIRFVLNNGGAEDKPIVDCVLGGVAVLDFDSDGYLDIFFTNGASIPALEKDGPAFDNRLFRNNHDGTFSDVTAKAGLAGSGYSMGAAAADFDNDGWTDLYVTGVNRNILYRNNGHGGFDDVTAKAGVGADSANGKPWSVAAGWFDYDNDGLLDLLVVNYLDWSFDKNRVCGDRGKRLSCSPELYGGLPNILYHNNGDGTFTDVSKASGIARYPGKGMSAAFADFDDDGFADVLITNDKRPNTLLHNLRGKSFDDSGIEAGAGFTGDGIALSNMGVDFRETGGDGRPEAFITALEGDSFLYLANLGNGLFEDRSYRSGIGYPSRKLSGWSVGIYDFDNDGRKDVFTANSHVSENAPLYGPHEYLQANTVFHRERDQAFRFVDAGLASKAAHRGAAFGDLNNDGKIDVVVSAIGSPAEILSNTSPEGNHWILIDTVGRVSNRDGIGTRIKITGMSGLTQYNHVTTAVGYASSSDKRVHFGLGADARIREIELRWPSGKVQRLHDVPADRVLKVVEP